MANQQCQFVQIPVEILTDDQITPTELRLYCILMKFGFEGTGYSQAGHGYLSKLVGCHKQTVAKSLKHLQELGYIEVKRIGLNRNDKIFCLKTVKNQKKIKSRSESKPVFKKSEPTSSPSISKNRTKKYRSSNATDSLVDGHAQMDSKNKYEEQIRLHKDDTEQFLQQIVDPCKPNLEKMFQAAHIIDSDSTQNTILVTSAPVRDFIQKFYKTKIEQIIGKEIRIVGS